MLGVLSRRLNRLFKDSNFNGYEIPSRNLKINCLYYTDGTILFCLGQLSSMRKMIKVLRNYELVSGKMINLDKSLMYLHEKGSIGVCSQIKSIIAIRQGSFPFFYWDALFFKVERIKVILNTWSIKL